MVSIKILNTKNFLGCFNIESGGIFIGYVGLFWAIAQLVVEIVLILSLAVVEDFCLERKILIAEQSLENYSEDLKNLTEIAQQGLQDLTQQAQDALLNVTNTEFSCTQISKFPIGLFLVFAIIFNVVGIFAHLRLIKGVKERDSSKFPLAIGFYKFFIIFKSIFLLLVTIFNYYAYVMIIATFLLMLFLFVDIYAYLIIEILRDNYYITSQENLMHTAKKKHRGKRNHRNSH